MFARLKLPTVALALVSLLAPTSFADGFGISYTKKTKHGGLSIGYSSGPSFGPGPSHCAPQYAPRRVWVPGHYETVYRQVWVEGCSRTVWVDPAYEFRRDAFGRTYPVCVSSGSYRRVQDPGRFETRPERVWIAGHWRC